MSNAGCSVACEEEPPTAAAAALRRQNAMDKGDRRFEDGSCCRPAIRRFLRRCGKKSRGSKEVVAIVRILVGIYLEALCRSIPRQVRQSLLDSTVESRDVGKAKFQFRRWEFAQAQPLALTVPEWRRRIR